MSSQPTTHDDDGEKQLKLFVYFPIYPHIATIKLVKFLTLQLLDEKLQLDHIWRREAENNKITQRLHTARASSDHNGGRLELDEILYCEKCS